MLLLALLGVACLLLAWQLLLRYRMLDCGRSRDLSKSTVLLTGGTDGVGKYALLEIVKMTPRKLVFVGRDLSKAARVVQMCKDAVESALQKASSPKDIVNLTRIYGDLTKGEWTDDNKFVSGSIVFCKVDVADLDQVAAFAEFVHTQTESVDLLINNAGGFYHERQVSKQNIELTMASNYLGHLWLADRLLPLLVKSPEARVVNLSSCMHWMTLFKPKEVKIDFEDVFLDKQAQYSYWYQYSISKLSVNLATKGMAQYLETNGIKNVKAVSVFPGVMHTALNRGLPPLLYCLTEILRPLGSLVGNSVHQGAQVILYTALEDFGKVKNGAYYFNCRVSTENSFLGKPENIARFWKFSLAKLSSLSKGRPLHFGN